MKYNVHYMKYNEACAVQGLHAAGILRKLQCYTYHTHIIPGGAPPRGGCPSRGNLFVLYTSYIILHAIYQVERLHAAGILHGAISPETVIHPSEGGVALFGFGFPHGGALSPYDAPEAYLLMYTYASALAV